MTRAQVRKKIEGILDKAFDDLEELIESNERQIPFVGEILEAVGDKVHEFTHWWITQDEEVK